jgi:hypothetical protein
MNGPLAGNGQINNVLARSSGRQRSYESKVLSYSPLAYWKLDETSGTIAVDSSVNANAAAYVGPTLAANTFLDGSPAPNFDGTNDYVNLYSAGLAVDWDAADPNQGTIALWVRVSGAGVWTDGTAAGAVTTPPA